MLVCFAARCASSDSLHAWVHVPVAAQGQSRSCSVQFQASTVCFTLHGTLTPNLAVVVPLCLRRVCFAVRCSLSFCDLQAAGALSATEVSTSHGVSC